MKLVNVYDAKTNFAVHVSAATVWELTIKAMLGKLRIPDDLGRQRPYIVDATT